MGLKYNPKGVTHICVSRPPVLHYDLGISFSFYLLSGDLPISPSLTQSSLLPTCRPFFLFFL